MSSFDPSVDPTDFLKEIRKQFEHAGYSPEELYFRFQCQKCGVRCCTTPHIETVWFPPHSFVYIRKILSKEKIQELFEAGLISWSVQPSTRIPILILTGDLCPFLCIHWDPKIHALFLRALAHPEIEADSKVPLLH